jgi:hypothetical protein
MWNKEMSDLVICNMACVKQKAIFPLDQKSWFATILPFWSEHNDKKTTCDD